MHEVRATLMRYTIFCKNSPFQSGEMNTHYLFSTLAYIVPSIPVISITVEEGKLVGLYVSNIETAQFISNELKKENIL